MIANSTNISGGIVQHGTLTVNAGTSLDSTSDAASFIPDTTTNPHIYEYPTPPETSGATYTWSVWIKQIGTQYGVYFGVNSVGAAYVTFPNCTIVGHDAGPTYTATQIGSWCYLTETFVSNTKTPQINAVASGNQLTFAGDGTSGFYIWGSQLEAGSTATSYIPTGGTTVTRAADQYTNPYGATYYNSQGFIQSAAPNVPRLDHDPTVSSCSSTSSCPPKGILIEESRTNMIPASQELFSSSTYWCQNCSNRGTTMADGVTATVSPDGTYDASSITTTSTSGYTVTATCPSITAGTTYTASAYVQKASLPAPNLFEVQGGNSTSTDGAKGLFNLGTGAVSSCTANTSGTAVACGTQSLPNSWYRFWVAFQTGSSTAGCVLLGNQTSTYGTTYIYGAQLETGSFPTSYIPTSTASVTRPKDLFTIGTSAGPGSGWYNSANAQGTLAAAGTLAQNMPTGTYPAFASMDDGTGQNGVMLYYLGMSGCCNLFGEIHDAGSIIVPAYPAISISPGTLGRSAWTFGSNIYAYATQGHNITVTQTSTVPNLTELRVGAGLGGSYSLDGWVNRITFLPSPQPATALPQYTQ